MKRCAIVCLFLILSLMLAAQDSAAEKTVLIGMEEVQLDSLSFKREKDIVEEYGFRDTDLLRIVAEKLLIDETRVDDWKRYLNLEVENKQLDEKTLRQLGISPYQALLAHQSALYGLNELNTVSEVSMKLKVPIKKLKELLGLNPLNRNFDHASMQVIGKDPEEIVQIVKAFEQKKIHYGASITLVGMLVVFFSLAICSLVISQMGYLNKKSKTQTKTIVIGKNSKIVSAPDGLNRNLIAAAITTLHIHASSIEERRRLLLTFKRAPINLWHASNVVNMPNREHQNRRS